MTSSILLSMQSLDQLVTELDVTLSEERTAFVDLNLDGIRDATMRKELLLHQISEIQKNLRSHGIENLENLKSESSVQELAQSISDKFSTVYSKNKMNMDLCQGSLERIEELKRNLSPKRDQITYSPKGRPEEQREDRGENGLISQYV